jgi:hypothetical protein
MNNRAKCKLCKKIIESFHSTDYVMCDCGEIAVDGGAAMRCIARDFKNFLRVDDEGNEIVVTVKENKEDASEDKKHSILSCLEEMIAHTEGLPSHVLLQPVTHYDHLSLMILIQSFLKSS